MFEHELEQNHNKNKKEEEKENEIKEHKNTINVNNFRNMSEKLVLIILKHSEKMSIDKLRG